MKTSYKILAVAITIIFSLVGCGHSDKIATEEMKEIKIGVLVGSGGVEDRALNELAWEGIRQFTDRFPKATAQIVVPRGDSLEDRLKAAEDLLVVKSDLIIALGMEYSEVVKILQDKHSETSFILIDGELNKINSNTVVVNYLDQETAFLAGVAAALQSSNNKLGFIGGREEPAIERAGLGFIAGIAYVNNKYGTGSEIVEFKFQESFNNIKEGQEIAQSMFDSGVDSIYVFARGTGIGAMNEAKARLERDEKVYIIGSERDQYGVGKLIDERSVTLTSTLRHVNLTLYELLDAYSLNEFPGGQSFQKNLRNNGISLPEQNYNFTNETKIKVKEVEDLIRRGDLLIPSTSVELIQMIESFGYSVELSPSF